MQTLSNRTRTVLVALAVVLSAAVVAPMAGGVPTEEYTQQDGGDGSDGDEEPAGLENATEVDSLDDIEGTIGEDGRPEVYAVELNEGSGIELTDGTVGGGPIELLDRDGTVLDTIPAGTNFTGEEYTLRAQAGYTGTYYLRVGGETGDTYEISSRVIEPDANEPDDTPEEATAIDLGEREQGTAIKGGSDFYALELEAGTDIAIEANGTAAAAVTLVDLDGERLASSEILYPDGYVEGELGRQRIVETTAEQGGTYYLEVAIPENNTGDVNGEYNLTVVGASEGNSTEPSDDSTSDDSSAEDSTANDSTSDESTTGDAEDGSDAPQRSDAEPNDDIETATQANETGAINGDIDGAGDVDYYALNATAGSQFEISQGIGSSAVTLTLLDEDGNTVATRPYRSTYRNEEALLIANASETGTYYLRVEGEASDRYSIGVGITEPDTYEPNDAIDSATAIDAGQDLTGTIVRGDTDYFAIEAAAGERLAVNATGVESSQATLFGPDGETIESGRIHSESSQTILDDPSARTVLNTTVEESGTYYVGIEQDSSYVGEINGAYDLIVIESGDSTAATTTATETGTAGETESDETTTDEASNDASEPTADATTTANDSGSTVSSETTDDTGDASESSETGTERSETTDSDVTSTESNTASTGDGTTASSETTSGSGATDAPTETPTDAGTGAGTETANGGDGSVVEDAEETAVNGPGFGIVAALLALLGAALLATRRN
jgi:PGF-CTERM protein